MKLQINSLQALERLIGGDTNVEIEIRNNIVQEFAKKHLKALVNEGTIKAEADKLDRALRLEVQNVLSSKFGTITGSHWNQTFTINPKCKSAIEDIADRAYRAEIQKMWDCVENDLRARFTPERIEAEIERKLTSEINRRIDEGVKARLDAIKNTL